jgi:mono/diheme cytochrome c family protein
MSLKNWIWLLLGALAASSDLRAAPAPVAFPPVFYAAESVGKIQRYDERGKVTWDFPAEMARDVQVTTNGNVLFCYNKKYDSKRNDQASGVMEVTPQKQVVFHFQTTGQVWTCQRLPDGRTLVGNASRGEVLLVSSKGAVEKTIRIQNAPGHSALRHARYTPNGHILVAEESASAIREYDLENKVVREIKTPFRPFSVAVLPDGLIIVSGQTGIMAYNLANRVMWQVNAKDLPTLGIRWFAGFQLLEGNRLLICNAGGKVPLFALAPSKTKTQVLWHSGTNQLPMGHAAALTAPWLTLKPKTILVPEDHAVAARELDQFGVREIVFATRTQIAEGHWYANFGYYAAEDTHPCYGVGGRLVKLDLETGATQVLVDDVAGTVRDPAVHYDGRTLVFAWRKGGTEQFHLYKINADGSGLKQLTDGKYDDLEPSWLPDGGIVFISSRCRRWVNCWLTQVATIHRCDADGQNVTQLSANLEHDNTPWMLPDGRIAYQRWEYVDRSQVHYHHLWTMYPDGTSQMIYFGNQHPGGVFIDAKPIPDSDAVVLINSPGHGGREHIGYLATLNVRKGPDETAMLRNISAAPNMRDPFPLSTNAFLVAADREIRLFDAAGKSLQVYALPTEWADVTMHEPRPLVPHSREMQLPARTKPEQTTGVLACMDVYLGRNMEGVKRGDIKKLLILESLPKPINYTGGMEPLTYGGSFTLERILGTVPVESDGSAYFEMPASRACFFVALDEQGRSVKRMQSFCTVMPGERTGCIGCHEPRTATMDKIPAAGNITLAMHRAPSRITPLPGIPEVIDYTRNIQPIWNRHCIGCHSPDKPSGHMLLTGDAGPMYSHSYVMLTLHRQVADGRNQPKSNYAPRTLGDVASPLMQKLEPTHHDVKVSAAEKDMVRCWINSAATWPGTYAALGCGMIGGYAQNNLDRSDEKHAAVQAMGGIFDRRCGSCHGQKGMQLPRSLSDEGNISFWMPNLGDPRIRFSRHIVFNLSRPDKSLLLLAPLAKAAGGWAETALPADPKSAKRCPAVFKDTTDPDYVALLAAMQAGKAMLDSMTRFNMSNFTPRPAYLREMKRYGILPPDFDPAKQQVDVYDLDRRYWEALWHQPSK